MEVNELYCPQPTAVRLLIENVPRSWSEDSVAAFLGCIAKVSDIQIVRDLHGASKGSALATFASMTEADVAVEALSGRFFLPGAAAKLQIRWADGESRRLGITVEPVHANKLIALNVPAILPNDALIDLFCNYGALRAFHAVRDERGTRCYVKYTTKEQSLFAIRELHSKRFLPNTEPIELVFAAALVPRDEPAPPAESLFYEFAAPDGALYYFNWATRETQWQRPVGAGVEVRSAEAYRRDREKDESAIWKVEIGALPFDFDEVRFGALLNGHAPLTAYIEEANGMPTAVARFQSESAARAFAQSVESAFAAGASRPIIEISEALSV